MEGKGRGKRAVTEVDLIKTEGWKCAEGKGRSDFFSHFPEQLFKTIITLTKRPIPSLTLSHQMTPILMLQSQLYQSSAFPYFPSFPLL